VSKAEQGVKTESRVSDLEQVPEQGISNYSLRTINCWYSYDISTSQTAKANLANLQDVGENDGRAPVHQVFEEGTEHSSGLHFRR